VLLYLLRCTANIVPSVVSKLPPLYVADVSELATDSSRSSYLSQWVFSGHQGRL